MSNILDIMSRKIDRTRDAVEDVMHTSFEEKSVWIQLAASLIGLGAYCVIAAKMLAAGVNELPGYAALFVGSIILMVVILVSGHILVALAGKPEGRDERDRMISWRAESNSAWLMAVGIFTGITGLLFTVPEVWVVHALLLSLYAAEILAFTLRIIYYRKGI